MEAELSEQQDLAISMRRNIGPFFRRPSTAGRGKRQGGTARRAAVNRHPLLVGLPCALAASMAFMLPIATPTNAVALGSGKIEFTDFIRAGWKMNFIGIALVTLFVCTTGNWMFGLDDPAEGFKKDWLCNRPGSNMTCPSCYVFASCDYCGSANGTQPPGC